MKKLILLILLSVNLLLAMPSYNDVLVVVNINSAQSIEIGDYYINARNIPAQNRFEIAVPAGYNILSSADKVTALAAIKNYLESTGLTNSINHIVICGDMPIYVDNDPNTDSFFTHYLMHGLADNDINMFAQNSYFYYLQTNYNNRDKYKFTKKRFGFYSVSRLDGNGTATAKKLIDNSGFIAYDSYKTGINFFHNSIYSWHNNPSDRYGKEFLDRGNINTVWGNRDLGNRVHLTNLMFTSWDQANGQGEIHYEHPYIFKYFHFLPGSVAIIFRSSPNRYHSRMYGGLCSYDGSLFTNYVAADGSDIAYKHLTAVAYDPQNDYLWCGTGVRQFDDSIRYGSDDNLQKQDQEANGGGIVVYNRTSRALVYRFTEGNGLINNRVVKLVYDKYYNRMWIITYKGIQYYDCAANGGQSSWSSAIKPGVLSGNDAHGFEIYVDPFQTNKIYTAYACAGAAADSTQLPGGETTVFEYNKDTDTVSNFILFGSGNERSWYPRITKTASNYLWTVFGKDSDTIIKKYDINTSTVVYSNKLINLTPLSLIASPRVMISTTNSFNETNIYLGLSEPGTNVYVLRLTETGPASFTTNFIMQNELTINASASSKTELAVSSITFDLNNPDTMYLSVIGRDAYDSRAGRILKSTDGRGSNWTIYLNTGVENINDLCVDNTGTILGARGYEYAHQSVADFIHYGACAVGGGVSHYAGYFENKTLDNNRYTTVPGYLNMPYWAQCYGNSSQDENGDWLGESSLNTPKSIAFMLLDGYYMGEAVHAVNFPYIPRATVDGTTVVFDPKCAPYAPRVDETGTSLVINNRLAAIKLFSPGLYNTSTPLDGFMPATITTNTVRLYDYNSNYIPPSSLTYISNSKEIYYYADTNILPGSNYLLTLTCGANGIINLKGASLVNTRSNEFLDEITYLYTGGTSTNTGSLHHFGFASEPVIAYGNPSWSVSNITNFVTLIAYDAAANSNFTPPLQGNAVLSTEPPGGFSPFVVSFSNLHSNVITTVPVVFNSPTNGSFKIKAVCAGFTGESAGIIYYANNSDHFVLTLPQLIISNVPFDIKLRVTGPGGESNNLKLYTNTVWLSNDLAANLPANYTFTLSDSNAVTFTNCIYGTSKESNTVAVYGPALISLTNQFYVYIGSNTNLDHFTFYENTGEVLYTQMVTNIPYLINIYAENIYNSTNFFPPLVHDVLITTEPAGGFTPFYAGFNASNFNIVKALPVTFTCSTQSEYKIKIIYGNITNVSSNITVYLHEPYYVNLENMPVHVKSNIPFNFTMRVVGPNYETDSIMPLSGFTYLILQGGFPQTTTYFDFSMANQKWLSADNLELNVYNVTNCWFLTNGQYEIISYIMGYPGRITNYISVYDDTSIQILNPQANSWISSSPALFYGAASSTNGELSSVYFGSNLNTLLPAAGLTNWTNTMDITALDGRTNIFYAVLSNINGDIVTNLQTNYIDLSPPVISINADFNNAAIQGSTNISGTIFDPFSPVTGGSLLVSNAAMSKSYGIQPDPTNWTNTVTSADYATGYYNFYLFASNACGLVSVITQTNVFITNLPIESSFIIYQNGLNLYEVTSEMPVTFEFINNSIPGNGAVTNRLWNFGDGQTAITEHAAHEFTAGAYWVSLKLINDQNETSIYSNRIKVNYPSAVALYRMNEGSGSIVTDESPGSNNGAVTAGTWSSGIIDGSIYFNGSSSYINCSNAESIMPGGEFSISAWIYATEYPTSTGRTVASTYRYTATNRYGWTFGATSLGSSFSFSIYDANSNHSGSVSDSDFFTVETNKWMHVVGVFKPAQYLKLYVNSQLAGSDTSSVPTNIVYFPGDNLNIGRRTTGGDYFGGLMDDVRMYNYAITEAEIQNLFNLTNTSFAACFQPYSGGYQTNMGANIGTVPFNFINTSTWGTGNVTNIAWDFGDGTVSNNITNVSHSFTNGSYWVKLAVVDDSPAVSIFSNQIFARTTNIISNAFTGSCVYTTIQSAISAGGSAVYLYPGQYQEGNILPAAGMTISSISNNPGQVVINALGSNIGIYIYSKNNTVISGITISNATNTIYISGTCSGNLVTNCNILENANPGYGKGIYYTGVNVKNNLAADNNIYGHYRGVYLQDCIGNTIQNNLVHDNTNMGCYLSGAAISNIFIGNKIYCNSNDGIYFSSATTSENLIYGNMVCSNLQDGININLGSGNKVINNTVFSNYNYGIYAYQNSGNNIASNAVFSNRLAGIYVYGNGVTSQSNIVCSNVIYGSYTSAGIDVNDSDHLDIFRNLVRNNQTFNIRVQGGVDKSTNVRIINNTIYKSANEDGISWQTASWGEVYNNIIISNGSGAGDYGIASSSSGTVYVGYNVIDCNFSGPTNGTGLVFVTNYFTDPLVNISADFSITNSSSPAVDNATNIPGISDVSAGTGPDLGWIESIYSKPLPSSVSVSITNPAAGSWLNTAGTVFSGSASASNSEVAAVYFGSNLAALTLCGGTTNWTNYLDLSGQSGKTNIFYTVASNTNGDLATNWQTNVIDLTPPACAFSLAYSGAILAETTNISGTVTEDFSPLTGSSLLITNNSFMSNYILALSAGSFITNINTMDFPNGSYDFILSAANEAGLTSMITQANVIFSNATNTAPVASFAVYTCGLNTNEVTAAGSVNFYFTNTSSDNSGVTGYTWQFGDGSSTNVSNTLHSYSGGSCWVTLTVSDAGGLFSAVSNMITVHPYTNIIIYADPPSLITNALFTARVSNYNESIDATNYIFIITNSVTNIYVNLPGCVTNIQYAPADNQSNTVILFATNTAGHAGAPITNIYVLDTIAPWEVSLASPAPAAEIASLDFTWLATNDSTGAPAYSYLFEAAEDTNFTSALLCATNSATNFTSGASLTNGAYYWRVRSLDTAGNISSNIEARAFVYNGINLLPTLSIEASASRGRLPALAVYFTAKAEDADGTIASCAWNFGNGRTSTLLSATNVYSNAGVYTAECIVTDNKGGSASAEIKITVLKELKAPDKVYAAAQSPTVIHIAWKDAGDNELGYILYKGNANNPAAAAPLAIMLSNVTNWTDESARAGTEYYYWVQSFFMEDNSRLNDLDLVLRTPGMREVSVYSRPAMVKTPNFETDFNKIEFPQILRADKNDKVLIPFVPQNTELTIATVDGKVIARAREGDGCKPGYAVWNIRGDKGRNAPMGLYVIRFAAGKKQGYRIFALIR